MTTDNGVYSYLDCSTAHITQEADEYLDSIAASENGCGLSVMAYNPNDYGYFISVEKDVDDVPACLNTIMDLAVTLKCAWLKLSPDGMVHESLPKYNW